MLRDATWREPNRHFLFLYPFSALSQESKSHKFTLPPSFKTCSQEMSPRMVQITNKFSCNSSEALTSLKNTRLPEKPRLSNGGISSTSAPGGKSFPWGKEACQGVCTSIIWQVCAHGANLPVEQVRLGLEPTKASMCPQYVWSVWVMGAGDTLATPLPPQGHPIFPRDFSQVLARQGKVAHAFVFLKSSPPPLPSGH